MDAQPNRKPHSTWLGGIILLSAAMIANTTAVSSTWEDMIPVDVDGSLPDSDPNASSMIGLTVAGYQGWFATPNDDDNSGWVHWGPLKNGTGIQEDFWPDMTEYTPSERHAAPGYFYPNGSQAELFSSDNMATVLRHFQWMEAYGIDGVAVQRFGVENSNLRLKRRLNYTVQAAEQTGRVMYIEYDMSGMKEEDIVQSLTTDWAQIVQEGITKSPRYLHQNGLPVVGIFGFYMDRFSATTAAAILDIFQKPGPNQAFVAGAGQWFWFKSNPSKEWQDIFHRMGSWSPWNMGNWNGNMNDPHPNMDYWTQDKQDMEAHGVIWVPEIYPGCSTAHRDGKPPGSKGTRIPRNKGAFLWEQFVYSTQIKVQTAFIGMFDELDEGTMILKATNEPPVQATGDIGYEGMPSDVYLCWAGKGTKMMRGELPLNSTKPDCSSNTQPTIPAVSISTSGIDASKRSTLSWSKALALKGGGSISHYEIIVGGSIRRTANADITQITVPQAESNFSSKHHLRVRAVNTLGVRGGWSLRL